MQQGRKGRRCEEQEKKNVKHLKRRSHGTMFTVALRCGGIEEK